MQFYTAGASDTITERMRITSGGSVGIATTTAGTWYGEKLSVAGIIHSLSDLIVSGIAKITSKFERIEAISSNTTIDTSYNNILASNSATITLPDPASVCTTIGGKSSCWKFTVKKTDSSGTITILPSTNLFTATTTAATSSDSGSSWTSPQLALVEDGSFATATIPDSSSSSHIKATNFGFSIPSNGYITGITAGVKAKRTGGSDISINCQIIKGGVIGGNEKSAGTSTTLTKYFLGGDTDLWGNTLTYSDVNSSNFGLACKGVNDGVVDSTTFSLDSMELKVWYVTGRIDGASSKTLTSQYQVVTIQSNGTDYYIMGN
jgi:hypothetical protein